MTFSAKIAIRSTAPPENMLNMPRMPWDLFLEGAGERSGSMPGIGM
jgi:hypothetical protein